MADGNLNRVRFEHSQPILRIEDMPASLRFHVDLLGFKNLAWGNADFTSVNPTAPVSSSAAADRARDGHGSGSEWKTLRSCTTNTRRAV